MKLKLIDTKFTYDEQMDTGTCDLCFSISYCDICQFTFLKEDGTKVNINSYEWLDCYDVVVIDDITKLNIVDLASYINTKDFPNDLQLDYDFLSNLIDEFLEKEKNEEKK